MRVVCRDPWYYQRKIAGQQAQIKAVRRTAAESRRAQAEALVPDDGFKETSIVANRGSAGTEVLGR